jgi:hypothetical protein
VKAAPRFDRRDWAAVAFLALAAVLVHGSVFAAEPTRRSAYPEGDFYDQFYAFASYEHDRLWQGEIPLWNPYVFGGHPFLADVQAAVFYPPSLLTVLLSGPKALSPWLLHVEAILHYGLAASFMYAFARRASWVMQGQVRRGGALIAAVILSFGGYLTSYPPLQLAILETQVWFPLILLLVEIGLSERRWLLLLGAGVAWGMALLAGHPQSAMYVLYGTLAYGLFRSIQLRLPWKWWVGGHLAWIGIGLGLAAVHWIPAWEFMQLSVRASTSYQELAGGFGLRDLAQYLVPGAFTLWSPVYVGILTLFLVAVPSGLLLATLGHQLWGKIGKKGTISTGLRDVPRMATVSEPVDGSRETPGGSTGTIAFWLSMALISLVLALGGNGFLYRLFYGLVPGFDLFRSQERAIYVTGFAWAVLAGCGWDRLSTARERPVGERSTCNALRWALDATLGGILVFVGVCALGWMHRFGPGWSWNALHGRLLRLAGIGLASWALLRFLPRKQPWGLGIALALLFVDLSAVNQINLSPGAPNTRLYDGGWLIEAVGEGSLARIANEWGLPGNVGCLLRLYDLYGASPLRLQMHRVMADALPHWRLWQLFGVRYVATWEHDLPGPFPAERVATRGAEWEKDTVYVHRIQDDFPRAWVVYRARQASLPETLELLQSPDFDPFDEVLVNEAMPLSVEASVPDSTASASLLQYAPEAIVVQADLTAPGWLVVSEWSYPGWQAWVDGSPQKVFRVDYGLRAVPLSQGMHRVEFRYRPMSVYVGAAVSAVTLCVCAVACVMRGRWPGRRRVPPMAAGQAVQELARV